MYLKINNNKQKNKESPEVCQSVKGSWEPGMGQRPWRADAGGGPRGTVTQGTVFPGAFLVLVDAPQPELQS